MIVCKRRVVGFDNCSTLANSHRCLRPRGSGVSLEKIERENDKEIYINLLRIKRIYSISDIAFWISEYRKPFRSRY